MIDSEKGTVTLEECGDLTMNQVGIANRARCERWHPGFPDDTVWTGADWALAMVGEAGEAANVVKKLRRVEVGTPGVMDPSETVLRAALADELADVYLYLDLLAAKYGIDLPGAVASKFNRVSARQDFPERLTLVNTQVTAQVPIGKDKDGQRESVIDGFVGCLGQATDDPLLTLREIRDERAHGEPDTDGRSHG